MGEPARTRTTPPRRGRLEQPVRRALAGAAALLLLGAPATAASAAARPAAASALAVEAAADRAPITLDNLSPTAPVKGDTLTLAGTVRNSTGHTWHNAKVRLRTGTGALGSRSTINEVSKRTTATAADGTPVDGADHPMPDITAGGSATFTLKVPVSKLRLTGDGVYELAVELTAENGASLGIDRTFLPWFPSDSGVQPTRTAALWPVVDEPRVTARTMADVRQTPVLRNDGLTSEMRSGGRLDRIVKLGDSLPVTWVVDPDLAITADAMAGGYRVASGSGTKAGSGGTAAKQWLTELQWAMVDYKDAAQARKQLAENGGSSTPSSTASPSATASPSDTGSPSPSASAGASGSGGTQPNPADYPHDDVVGLPVGDPDLASIAHRGHGSAQLSTLLSNAQELSANASTALKLGVQPRTDVAWPVQGWLDSSIIATGKQAKASSFIANSDSIGRSGLPYTPSARRNLAGGLHEDVADSAIGSILSRDLSTPASRAEAVQEILAQTLMVTMEAPSKQRTLLIVPPRRMTTDQATVLAEALKAADKGGWIDPISLKQLQQTAPDPSAPGRVPSASAYPSSLRATELSSATLGQVATVNAQLQDMVRILTAPQRVTGPFNGAMMRTVSTAWREDPSGERAFEKETNDYLDDLAGAVRIAPKSSTITLSGQSATIPVTVLNNLEQTVQVVVRMQSDQPTRVTVGDGHRLNIPPRTNRQVEFPTTATTNGRAVVTVRLYDLQGKAYGPTQRITINVTSAGNSVLIVVGLGLLIVVVAIIRMYRKRARRQADGGPQGDAPQEGPGEGPDEGADTAADGAEGSGADEKVEG
ncbi:hypothetical protein BIV57_11945 [Mangrovactinospora gilvigrisea]|uniref:Uncharacterized protein n=1 Tax=Mangrovactinospora gilvigrisea TaxID=1428644 RepID=A0A1J7CC35_9ACTN|nr:DUF6049 family protein [Mangrovactinospora gilvigrisea]OIV37226.1 hypothetical protein BIV57_11945 [Mangrovactinospora gilvigrisea]